jgi:putative PIN family toxin of toxin-antitoxin system
MAVSPTQGIARDTCIVLDTNIVLDLFVFADAATPPLREALESKALRWLATQAMRDELERVLAYTHIVPRLAYHQRTAEQVLARFDAQAHCMDVPPQARYVCKDADDQKFIDLAVANQALLLSKDKAVLSMARRLRTLGVETSAHYAS